MNSEIQLFLEDELTFLKTLAPELLNEEEEAHFEKTIEGKVSKRIKWFKYLLKQEAQKATSVTEVKG